MNRADIENFFKTLILGDFEAEQNTAAQIVGGLISLIPILDQVLDVRDISGVLFRINKHGGFKQASSEQVVDLGFAAFGAVPEVGSAFKTVFKPLWKQRRAVKGAVNSGAEAIEALLGMKKGGAISWMRKELLGKWAARTQQAALIGEGALGSCIELLEFIATASGWKDWLIPDSIQSMAKELLPSLKDMQGGLGAAIRRASNEIREFLEDILGEQAAAVVMAVGERAAVASAVPGTRARQGRNAADPKPKGRAPKREEPKAVQASPETQGGKGRGPVYTAAQATRKAFQKMASLEKGLIGEHVVDYHEAKRLGGHWQHDNTTGQWAPASTAKINRDKRPVVLSLADLKKVNKPGIDAVWEHNGSYTVTEAKASESIAVAYGFGKYKVKKGLIPDVGKLTNRDHELLHFLLSDASDKADQGWPMMQMSTKWVQNRAPAERLDLAATAALENNQCARRVVLVTSESSGALDHATALADIHLLKPEPERHQHPDHGVLREWSGGDIDTVERARARAHKTKTAAPEASRDTSPAKAGRSKKR